MPKHSQIWSFLPSIPSPEILDGQNLLIRALAVRTIGCIPVEKIIDYLAGQ